MNFLLIFWLIGVLFAVNSNPINSGLPNKLLYIMLGGFRYDFVEMQPAVDLPGLNKFIREGVRAEWMTPIFPSHSLPDWTTLVTGLWAESHGIVGNYIYDSTEEDVFDFTESATITEKKWWKFEPIWTTVTKAGLKAGVIKWARCDVTYDNILPEHCDPFDYPSFLDRQSFTNDTKTALTLLENGYDLVQVYTPYLDKVGHRDGPETEDMKKAVQFIDKHISYVLKELQDREIEDKVNVIIVSDHGMKDIYPGVAEHIELDDYIDLDLVEAIIQYGAYSNIKTVPGAADQVFTDLKKMKGVTVYMKENIPIRFHYKDNKYIHEILIVAKEGYFIKGSRSDKQIPRRNGDESEERMLATHGFDPINEKMRAIFLAKGPDFHKNKRISAIQNVDVYPLLAHLLKVNPLPHNGTIMHVEQALIYPVEKQTQIFGFITNFIDYLRNL